MTKPAYNRAVMVDNQDNQYIQSAAESLIIQGLAGQRQLSGQLAVDGAKNAALKALVAAWLFDSEVVLNQVPAITDIQTMIELMADLGFDITVLNQTVTIKPQQLGATTLDRTLARRLRASIVLTGPILARLGQVTFSHPGGCVIGQRPIDMFLRGLAKMGAKITQTGDTYHIVAPAGGLTGSQIFFPQPTVTGTETFLLAGVLARGTTVLDNAAMEPEIVSLGQWLKSAGAKITGLGTPTITIVGTGLLKTSPAYHTLPDRIEAGSWLILAALAAQEVKITNCEPQHLTAVIDILTQAGVVMDIDSTTITVAGHRQPPNWQAVNIKTHEYPGFPTDLQAPMAVFLTQSQGQSFIFETIFENRLGYLEALNRQGAQTKLLDAHRALITGPTPLSGGTLDSPDLRAGLAYIIAAIIASGRSIIHNIHYIDRGYVNIDTKLQCLGLNIKRVNSQDLN